MKTVLIKISGKAIDNFLRSDYHKKLLTELAPGYDHIVIVHGGGKMISEWASALGIDSNFIDGQRVTTPELMEVVAAVQSGLINSKIIASLNSSGYKAVGLSGISNNTFIAKEFDSQLGLVGIPNLASPVDWIYELLDKEILPVFSSVCYDGNGNLINVNADLFAAELAAAIKADCIMFFSDVEGIIYNGEVKRILNETEILHGINSKQINNGMLPKLNSCLKMLSKGIKKIWIGSGSKSELPDIQKEGTWIIKSGEQFEKLHYVA
jgi:acetylglutamate kinase